MTELSGSLGSVGLPALVRFLAELGKSGRLVVWQDRWSGEAALDGGRIVAASFGSERGLAALDAIALALAEGEFAFSEGPPPEERNLELSAEELRAHLEGLEAPSGGMAAPIASPAAVPRIVQAAGQVDPADRVSLARGTLAILLAVDGRRTVEEIAAGRGLAATLRALGSLRELGLVGIDPPPVAPPTSAVAPAPVAGACPMLGFVDDRDNRFARPTQLHRCFATERPEPVSTAEQRELCLTDRFGTCSRLTGASAPAARPTTGSASRPAEPSSTGPAPNRSADEEPNGRGEAAAPRELAGSGRERTTPAAEGLAAPSRAPAGARFESPDQERLAGVLASAGVERVAGRPVGVILLILLAGALLTLAIVNAPETLAELLARAEELAR